MSHRSKVLMWSTDTDHSESIEKMLDQQGISLTNLKGRTDAEADLATKGANALVLDFHGDKKLTEHEFESFWAAARKDDLKVYYLTPDRTQLPAFAQTSDEALQIISGPALDQQLLARMRRLTRLETMAEELKRRGDTLNAFGIDTPYDIENFHTETGKVLLVGDPSTDFNIIESTINSEQHTLFAAYTQQMALEFLENDRFDLIIYNASTVQRDVVEFISTIRRDSRFFNVPLLVLGASDIITDPVEIYASGATDVLFKPICTASLADTSHALIREHCYHRHLSSIYDSTRQDSVLDHHTGLFRHGFLMDHLQSLVEQCFDNDTSMTVAFFDIFNLAEVNQKFGYAAGDSLIRQVGNLVSHFFRGEDLCARYGGGEFVAVLPRTRMIEASLAIRRLVSTINQTQFQLLSGSPPANFLLTFGEAEYEHGDTAETLIERAHDQAHHH